MGVEPERVVSGARGPWGFRIGTLDTVERRGFRRWGGHVTGRAGACCESRVVLAGRRFGIEARCTSGDARSGVVGDLRGRFVLDGWVVRGKRGATGICNAPGHSGTGSSSDGNAWSPAGQGLVLRGAVLRESNALSRRRLIVRTGHGIVVQGRRHPVQYCRQRRYPAPRCRSARTLGRAVVSMHRRRHHGSAPRVPGPCPGLP